jgi:hypothetical protein
MTTPQRTCSRTGRRSHAVTALTIYAISASHSPTRGGTHDAPIHRVERTELSAVDGLGRQTIVPAPHAPVSQPLGWGSIFAAAAITVALTMFFHLFGIGIGLTSIDPTDPGSLRSVGIGTGLWSIAAPIIALFIGGLVAGRTAPTLNRTTAAIHGAATWAITSIAAVFLIGAVFGALSRAATMTASAVASSFATSTEPSATGSSGTAAPAAAFLQMDRDKLLARLNDELAARGMPRVERENVDAAIAEGMRRAMFEGGIDRDTAIAIAAKHTALSPQQAEQIARHIEQEVLAAKQRERSTTSSVPATSTTALTPTERTGQLVLGLSLAMLLGLFTAMVGAALGARRPQRLARSSHHGGGPPSK